MDSRPKRKRTTNKYLSDFVMPKGQKTPMRKIHTCRSACSHADSGIKDPILHRVYQCVCDTCKANGGKVFFCCGKFWAYGGTFYHSITTMKGNKRKITNCDGM